MAGSPYDTALARYETLVTAFPDLKVKGKANRYTAMNGNMFSFLDKSGELCLRLSKDDRASLDAQHATEPVLQYGSVMKEYVALTEAAASDPDILRALFEKSVAHAASLKPKPTKRR